MILLQSLCPRMSSKADNNTALRRGAFRPDALLTQNSGRVDAFSPPELVN